MQVGSSSSPNLNAQSLIKNATDKLQSGVPFEIPVDTPAGTETLKGEFHYGFIQPAGQDLYFTPGASGAPEAAKQALANALQQFLLSAQEDAKAGGTPAAGTYSTNTTFSGQNSGYSYGGTFSLLPDKATKTA